MRAKTLLSVLFLISLVVAAWVVIRALPKSDAATEAGAGAEILVATALLETGTLLRATDVSWEVIPRAPAPGEIVRPSAAAREANPEIDEQARAQAYGAVLRTALAAGEPIHRYSIVKPLEREFLQSVLAPGARAIAIPVATGGASTDLLSPGDRVDVVLTQKFGNIGEPLTRSSVAETVVENLRVLVVGALDAKVAGAFGRTVTLEVMPDQAEKIQVAIDLGRLSLTLRGASGVSTAGPGKATGIRPTWAGDVSPALGGAMPAERAIQAERPPVDIIRGARGLELVKQQ